MKINFYLFIYFLFLSDLKSAELVIKILNIEENNGLIHFAIYDKPEFFPENEGKKIGFKKKITELINDQVTITDLEESFYAVAIYHDKILILNSTLSYQFLKKNLVLVMTQKFFLDRQVLMRPHFF